MSHKMDQLKMNLNFAKKHEDSNLTHLKVKSEFYRIKNMKFMLFGLKDLLTKLLTM